MSKLLEKLKAEKEKLEKKIASGGGGGKYTKTDWYTPETGNNLIRFLPNMEDQDAFPYIHVRLHFIEVQKNDGGVAKIFVRCLQDFEEKCPVCVKYSQLIKTDRDAANPFKVSEKFVYNVLDYKTKTVKPYSVSQTLQNDILGFLDYGSIFSLEEGRDWQLTKGTDPRRSRPFNVTYKIRPSPNQSALQAKYKGCLEGMTDITKLYSTNEKAKMLQWLGDQPLVGFELFGKWGEMGFAGLPGFATGTPLAAPLAEEEPTPMEAPSRWLMYFNEIPDDTSWYTGVTFSNTGNTPAWAEVILFKNDGSALFSKTWNLEPLQQVTRDVWAAVGVAGPVPSAAYLRIRSNRQLTGFELNLSRSGAFRFDGIPAVRSGSTRLYFPVVKLNQGVHTYLRITSESTSPTTFNVQAFSANGDSLAIYAGLVGARGQTRLDLNAVFSPVVDQVSWIRLDASYSVLADAWVMNDAQSWLGSYLGLEGF